MPKIVISYRRQDSEAIAGRIRDRLVGHYSAESVFMDIDSIPYGVDFREQIQQVLHHTDILVAIIGPKWTGASRGGRARIREDTDPVRIEVERALESGIPVVPVLVNGVRMPKATDLPDSLKDLSYRNAAEVDAGRDFHQHLDRLIRSMDQILANASASGSAPVNVTAEGPVAPADAVETVLEPEAEGRPALPPEPAEEPTPEAEPADEPASAGGPREDTTVAADTTITAAAQGVPTRTPRRSAMALATVAALCVLSLGGGFIYLRTIDFKWPMTSPTKEPVVAPAPSPSVAAIDTSCKPSGAAAFYDDFKTPDGGWGQVADTRFFKDGQMVLRPMINASRSWIYFPLLFRNVVICSEIVSPPEIKNPNGEAGGGIMFWATEYEHYYEAMIYTDGSYGIWRRASGKWVSVVARTPAPGLRQGPNAVNQLKVATGSNRATLFANGTKLLDFWGQPPGRGGAVGLFGESEKEAANEWKFSGIAVVEGTQETVPSAQALYTAQTTTFLDACKQNGSAAFFDEFASPDPSWGAPSDTRFFKDGRMVLKPRVKSSASWIFLPMIFKSGIVCADIKSPSEIKEAGGVAQAGVIFWASDYDNCYLAALYADATFAVFRKIDGKWTTLLARASGASIQQGENAVNRVKITFANDTATLTVNGSDTAQLRHAQPPDGGGAVGLYAGSESGMENEWNFLNIAVMENNPPPASARSTSPAVPSACKSSSPVAFFDNFTRPDPAWGPSSPTAYFDNSQMVLKPKSNAFRSWIYLPMVFEKSTVCSQIQSPPQIDKGENNAEGGLIFWAVDYENYYTSVIFADGTYSISRRVAGNWISVAPRAKADSIRQGPDAINQMTVTTAANMATLFVNDVKLVDIWGQPPRKGGAVGLYAQSETSQENEWRFSSIAVVEDKQPELSYPAAARTASNACKNASSPEFFDNFTPPDPGWGPVGPAYFFEDSQMVLKPKASTSESRIFAPLIFRDATICSEFKFPSQPQQAGGTSSVGIIFWAVDYQTYYVAEIDPDGNYWASRKINGEWVTVTQRAPAGAIHQGSDAVNRMKVVLDHNMASIVINDTSVIEFRGQPADAGGAVGLYGQSGKESDSEWRFTNIVVTN
jgi:hypothetical protein